MVFDKREYNRNYRQKHNEELKSYFANYYKNRRDRLVHLSQGAKSRLKLKKEILTYYGNGSCACVLCGFSDIRALTLDHKSGDGHHRSEEKVGNKTSGYYWYVQLKHAGYPEGYQTLCSNCQRIKQFENREWRLVKKSDYDEKITKTMEVEICTPLV